MAPISAVCGNRSTIAVHRATLTRLSRFFPYPLDRARIRSSNRVGRPSPPGDRAMDPLKVSIALQRLIFRHYPTLLQYKADGAVLIRMDEQGNVVDFPETSAAEGGNNPPDPKPGQGYYAHIQLTGIVVGAAVGGEKDVWEVRGPDWAAEVVIHEPATGDPWNVT